MSALVRKYLESLSAEESDFERRCRLPRETLAAIRGFSAGDRSTRDEVHERAAVR